MKKTASLIFILALPVSLTAQVDIAGESVKRVKHSVEVAFDIHTTPKTLKNRYKMVLTPYLCNLFCGRRKPIIRRCYVRHYWTII